VRRLLREYGAGETPQALKRRGGSPARPRKAKHLERKSTGLFAGSKIKIAEKDTFLDNLTLTQSVFCRWDFFFTEVNYCKIKGV
jgi:hypothetical protein